MHNIQSNPNDNSFNRYFLQDPSLIQNITDKQQKKIILYDLPQIQQYRKLNRPVVDQEKKRMIKQKLDLQQQSMLQTKQRQKRNQYFLNYSDNPFIDLQPHLKSYRKPLSTKNDQNKLGVPPKQKTLVKPGAQKDTNYQASDIVFQLNHMKDKDFKPDLLRMKSDFQNMKKTADLMSNKIIELSANKEDFQFFKNKKLKAEQFVKALFEMGNILAHQRKFGKDKQENKGRPDQAKQKKQTFQNPAVALLPENSMTFDEIIQLKQENFFMKSHKNLNIFKIAFNNSQKQMIGKELLNKYYFSFTSMVQKLQKIKIPIYRDISRMARKISLNVSTGKQDRFDYIDSYQLSFKTNSLTFADLMSVASGRFTPQFVSKTTNFDVQQNVAKQKSQTSSQQQQHQIFYEDNTKNVSVRFHNRGEQQQQIKNYLKLQCNSRQISYMSQCQRYKNFINSDLKMKQKLVSTTIQDKQLHGVINRSVKKQMKQFVNMDQRDIQIDRLIRMNKAHKNKNVSIKMEKVLEVFDLKKQHDNVISKVAVLDDSPYQSQNLQLSDKQKQKLKMIQNGTAQRMQAMNSLYNQKQTKINTKNNLSKTPQKQSNLTPQKVSKYDKNNINDKNNNLSTTAKKNPYNRDRSITPTKNETASKMPKWKF